MSNNRPTSKRTPSILVTDVRYAPGSRAPFAKSSYAIGKSVSKRSSFNDISIDNILSDVSDIPSAQARPGAERRILGNVGRSPAAAARNTGSAIATAAAHIGPRRSSLCNGVDSGGRGAPPRSTPNIPSRTSKVTERLVLIPDDGGDLYCEPSGVSVEPPPLPYPEMEDLEDLPRRSYAERLPRDKRAEKFPRVTAYCISDGIRLSEASEFLKKHHKIKPRIYDEALYAPYYLPLLPGDGEGSRVKSSPGGIMMLEQLIDQSEQGDHHYEYFSGLETVKPDSKSGARHIHGESPEWRDSEEFDPSEPQDFTPPRGAGGLDQRRDPRDPNQQLVSTSPLGQSALSGDMLAVSPPVGDGPERVYSHGNDEYVFEQGEDEEQRGEHQFAQEEDHNEHPSDDVPLQSHRTEAQVNSHHREPPPDSLKHAEMFIFSYGVIVFWNFTEPQEKDILADLTFARIPTLQEGLKSLVVRPISDQEIETEEMHFNYSPTTNKPRIYNDMITLKSGDHMIKLAMSHSIAQSTKLSRFEARMNVNMHDVKHVPKMLALTGNLGMKREEVLKISGKLFKLRVDVNLSSNVLDTPDFFWEAEPSLNPLYSAVREYLEIEQRILVLNERCKVFLELADIIAGSIAESNMSRITWIIIVLIAISLAVSSVSIKREC